MSALGQKPTIQYFDGLNLVPLFFGVFGASFRVKKSRQTCGGTV
jgi:hypothetical protein